MIIQNDTFISGGWKLQFIDEGTFLVDLAARSNRSEQFKKPGRFALSVSFLLVESPHLTFLIDLGLGSYPNQVIKSHNCTPFIPVQEKITAVSSRPVEAILFSHLHIDHIGCYLDHKDGSFNHNFNSQPCFVSAKEWEYRTERLGKADSVYKTYYEALRSNVQCTDVGQEVLPDVFIFNIGGHTPGHQTILINTGEYKVIYGGDLIATAAQLNRNRSLPYDFDPQQSEALREQMYDYARKENCIFALNHAPHRKFMVLEKTEKNK
jgi:glyoxylase-like metal-dependent hydrolase (beta-lactamase superfamily II)